MNNYCVMNVQKSVRINAFSKRIRENLTFDHKFDISLKWPTSHDTFFVSVRGRSIIYQYLKHIFFNGYRVPKYETLV